MRAISSGVAMRPSGCEAPMSPRAAWMSGAPASAALTKSVSTAPGATALTRTPSAACSIGELAGDLGDRALGRAVGALRGKPDDPRDRGDVDDRAVAGGDEVRQRLAAVDEDAAHVGGHEPVPLVVRRVDDRLEQEAARVVDDDVEAAEAAQGELDRRAGGLRVGGVAQQRRHPVVGERVDGRARCPRRPPSRRRRAAGHDRRPMPPAAPVTIATAALEGPSSAMAGDDIE